MGTLRLSAAIIWAVFWIGWLTAAFSAKESLRGSGMRGVPLRGLTALAVALLIKLAGTAGLRSVGIHSVALGGVGLGVVLAGLGVAVWARICLGRNWGMPMSQRAEPELVTGGPYARVRHPIYSGLLLAFVGTVLLTTVIGLVLTLVLVPYFLYAARIEEANLAEQFPDTYPPYRARTKLLIPWVL